MLLEPEVTETFILKFKKRIFSSFKKFWKICVHIGHNIYVLQVCNIPIWILKSAVLWATQKRQNLTRFEGALFTYLDYNFVFLWSVEYNISLIETLHTRSINHVPYVQFFHNFFGTSKVRFLNVQYKGLQWAREPSWLTRENMVWPFVVLT
jgi:hypothetical protein